MTARLLGGLGLVAVTGGLAWVLFVGLPQRYGPATSGSSSAQPGTTAGAAGGATPAAAPSASAARKIKTQLYYVGDDGVSLVSVERDVPFVEGTVEQARAILTAQLALADGLMSAIPAGTTLRALFLTNDGEAFLDLSQELSAGHAGGSTNELLTIYTLVNVLTTNLPAVTAVQLLVNGKEVETLAGHVDLRQPLVKNLTWVH